MTQTTKRSLHKIADELKTTQHKIATLLDVLHGLRHIWHYFMYEPLTDKQRSQIVKYLDVSIAHQDRLIDECEEQYGSETAEYFKKKRTELRRRECY